MPTSPEKIESLLGFALRAGKVAFGYDTLSGLSRSRLHLVRFAGEHAEKAAAPNRGSQDPGDTVRPTARRGFA